MILVHKYQLNMVLEVLTYKNKSILVEEKFCPLT